MKKVYSKKVGGEVFALAPEQLEAFRNAGYQTPTPEEVIADAGAAMLTPPENKRAYVVLNLKSGEFAVRVRSCTLKGSEYSAVVGEIVQAGLLKRLAEQADPDRPKPAAPAAGTASPFVALFAEAIKKAFVGGTEDTGQTAPADSAASPIGALISEAIKKSLGGAAAPSAPASAPAGAVNTEEVVDK